MGCISSKHDTVVVDVPRSLSLVSEARALRQVSFLGGARLLASAAAAPAGHPGRVATRVAAGDGHVFAALWQGVNGPAAAAFAAGACYEALLAALARAGEPGAALRDAARALDASYLASAAVPDLAKATVGAVGVMMFLDTRGNRVHVARVGGTGCAAAGLPFVAAARGAFNSARVDVKPLTAAAAAAAGFGGRSNGSSLGGGRGPTVIGLGCAKSPKLHALALKAGALPPDAGAPPPGTPRRGPLPPLVDVEVVASQLAAGDEAVVLASGGLLQLLPPAEVAALAAGLSPHALGAVRDALDRAEEAAEAAAAAAAAARSARRRSSRHTSQGGGGGGNAGGGRLMSHAGGERPPQPVAHVRPNVANIVTNCALAKALALYNRQQQHEQEQQQQQQLMSRRSSATSYVSAGSESVAATSGGGGGNSAAVACRRSLLGGGGAREQQVASLEQLRALPPEVDVEALRPRGAPASARLRLPNSYPLGGATRADVHGDVALVVVSVSWPASSGAQCPAATALASRLAAPLPCGGRPDQRHRHRGRAAALYRWHLLRLALRARRAYRRALRARWWEAVAAAQAAAVSAARDAEVRAWRVLGEVVRVDPVSGAVVEPQQQQQQEHLRLQPGCRAGSRTPPTPRLAPIATKQQQQQVTPPPPAAGPAERLSSSGGGGGGGSSGAARTPNSPASRQQQQLSLRTGRSPLTPRGAARAAASAVAAEFGLPSLPPVRVGPPLRMPPPPNAGDADDAHSSTRDAAAASAATASLSPAKAPGQQQQHKHLSLRRSAPSGGNGGSAALPSASPSSARSCAAGGGGGAAMMGTSSPSPRRTPVAATTPPSAAAAGEKLSLRHGRRQPGKASSLTPR